VRGNAWQTAAMTLRESAAHAGACVLACVIPCVIVGLLLVATGCGGGSGSGNDQIAVIPTQTATLAASPAIVTVGDVVNLKADYSAGTSVVDHGVGAIPPGGTAHYTVLAGDVGPLVFAMTVTAANLQPVTVQSPPVTACSFPAAPAITVPVFVTAGQSGYVASIPPLAQSGWTAKWTISGGTIDSGNGTNAIQFTPTAAGAAGIVGTAGTNATARTAIAAGDAGSTATAGTVAITCQIETVGGHLTELGSSSSTAVLPPVSTAVTVSNPTPINGATITVTPVFTDGTATLTGVGPVVSGTSYTVTVTQATNLVLTVTNAAGTVATTSFQVTPLNIAVGPVLPAGRTVTCGSQIAFTCAVSGGTNLGLVWTASAGTIDVNGKWTAPAVPGPCQITATSAAEPSQSASTSVTVVAGPRITSFTVN